MQTQIFDYKQLTTDKVVKIFCDYLTTILKISNTLTEEVEQTALYPSSIQNAYKAMLLKKLPLKCRLNDLTEHYGDRQTILDAVLKGRFPECYWEKDEIIDLLTNEYFQTDYIQEIETD